MSGLLPHVVGHAIRARSVFASSETFGVVAVAVLVAMLVERELLRVAHLAPRRRIALTALSAPLLLALVLTIVARLAVLVH